MLVLAGDNDERLAGEEFAELSRDEGTDHAADLGCHPLGAGPPLDDALALVEQGAHIARRRGAGGGAGARWHAPSARLPARHRLDSRDD